MKSLTAILKPVVLKEDAENACDDAFVCLDEIITMCTNLQEGLQAVEGDMDESMMNCISSTREHIKSACECALEAYGFDACCDTCKDGEEEEGEEEEEQKEEKDMGISKDDETEFHKKLDDLVHSTFGKRKDESVSEAESKQKTHMITMWLEKTLKVLEKIVKDISINAVEHGNLEKGVRYIISATKGTPFEEEFKKLSELGHGREYDKALIKLLTDIQDYYVDMSEAVSQKVKIGSKVKGIMGVYGRSQGTVVRFGNDRGKKIVYVQSPDGNEWNTPEYNIRVVEKLDEAKKIDEPEEAGLKDYVMPKSVIKMLAKHQFNRVKAGTKLFDAVSKVDKNKDLLHLYTSKKHKNILIGMFMVGEKASYFIHDTEAKSQRLDNAGRYKDLKGFVAALTAKFEGSEKNESAKKPLTKILGEADAKQRTPRALAFVKLLEKHGFAAVPKEHPLYKKYNKSGKLLGLYAIPMRAGKYTDIHIGVTSELVTDSYFITDGKTTKSFDNVADLTTYLKKLVASNPLNKLVEDSDISEKLKASDDVSVWIHDFVNSKNPKFAGKTKKERIDMALGAHYAAQGSKKKVTESIDRLAVALGISADKALDLLDIAAAGQSLSKTDAAAAAKFVKGLLALAYEQRITEDVTADRAKLAKILPTLGVPSNQISAFIKAMNSLENGATTGVQKPMLQKISDMAQELLRRVINNRSAMTAIQNTNRGL